MATQLTNLPLCQQHKLRLNYVCFNEQCKDRLINCGDCLFDHHRDHVANVSKIQDLVNQIDKNYKQLQGLQDSDENQVSRKSQIQQQLHEQINVSKQQFQQVLDDIQQQVNQQIEGLLLQGSQNGQSTAALAELNGYFTQANIQFNEEFNLKLRDLYAHYLQSQETQQNLKLIEEKFQQNINKIEQQYKKVNEVVEKELATLQKKLTNIIISVGSGNFQGISVWEYSFNDEKYNGFTFENNGLKINCTGGCNTDKYVISNETIPSTFMSFWEIKKNHTYGCYDSVGVCTSYQQRNGQSDKGWAVRCYGNHQDLNFTGKIHNGEKSKFYDNWNEGDKIGLLYNPFQKTLSYFVNGKFIGTPFDNVEGELYFLVEGCHHGSFEIIQNSEIPEQDEISKENIQYD